MPLRVMSYNVRYFGHALRGAGSTRGALLAIADAIAGLDARPDLVCLQEVETRSLRSRLSHTPGRRGETQLEALLSALDLALEARAREDRYTGYYFPAHRYGVGSAQLYTTGLAILAKNGLAIDEHNVEQPRDITHRRIKRVARLKQSRICAHVRFRWRGGDATTIDVFNTHLSLPAFAAAEFWRSGARMGYGRNQESEIDSLAGFVEEARASDRFLVLGDFNALPASPAYERLIERAEVRDPFPDIVGEPPMALRRAWPTAGFMHLRMRLDHVFVGPGIEALDFEDSHPYGAEGRWGGLSDHVPLVGRFRIKGAKRTL